VGVLIEGAAGAGKSALALELLGRGHALVADDAVELRRPAPGVVVGHAPGVLRGYLETRGLGVLDVRRMHGRAALRPGARVSLVVRLGGRRRLSATQRLGGRRGVRRILGEPVPVLSLAPASHNLAALVEAACLDQRLRDDGIDAAGALGRRQARALRGKGSDHFLPAVRPGGGLPGGK
jgi:HPr kinase/phosphorylase